MSSLAFLSHGAAFLPKNRFPNVSLKGLKHSSVGLFSQRSVHARRRSNRAMPTCVSTDSQTESKTDVVTMLENTITSENMELVISKAADIVDADISDIPSRRVFYSGVALWITMAMVAFTVASTVVAYVDRLPIIPEALRFVR